MSYFPSKTDKQRVFTKIQWLILISLFLSGCARGFLSGGKSEPTEIMGTPSNPPNSPLPPKTGGLGPTQGTGGSWGPGQTGRSPNGAYIYIPKSYKESIASSVIYLFHIEYTLLKNLADQENIILIDTEPTDRGATTTCNGGQTYPSGYVNQPYILGLIIESRNILVSKYNIDLSKVYFAGWSHGGDLAMKFGSLPSADTLAPDDSQDIACTSSPATLLPLQKQAHVGQVEVAGVMVFPGHYGFAQIDMWNKTNQLGTRRGCFAYSVGEQDSTYTQAYNILIPRLKGVKNYQNNIYYKSWPGWGHDLVPNSAAVESAWSWIKNCPP